MTGSNLGATVLDGLVIDRASTVPYYFQLKQAIAGGIRSGRLEPGLRLPSEPALCDRFGISRTTVRQALTELEAEGALRREKGRGTFVAATEDLGGSTFLQSASGFFEDARRAGHEVTSQVLRAETEALPAWASAALRQPPGAAGLALERVRLVDGQAVVYVLTYLPAAVAEGLADEDLATGSLYEMLRRRQGLAVAGGRRTITAVGAGAGVAGLLATEPEAPLLYVDSVSWDADGVPFECYRAWHRSDRVRLSVEVRPGGPNP